MALSQLTRAVFPPEIWPTVFSNFQRHHDLIHLWTDCRQVCRQFRDDVEHIFGTEHLKKTTIKFDCGVWYSSEVFGGKVNLRSISFGFDRLVNEGETAVFKIEGCAEEVMSEIMRRVSYCVAGSSIERPDHLVYFCRVANDTEVPNLAVDEGLREISFDWRTMFSRLFAETKLFLNTAMIEMDKAQTLKDKWDRGEGDMSETLEAYMAIAGRWEAEGQDCVFDEGFEEEEEAALATLKEAQFCAQFLEYSDDDEEAQPESGLRGERTTAKEEDDEDKDDEDYEDDEDDEDDENDENAKYESDDDQDVDEDEDVEEEDHEDADNEGGVGVDHDHEKLTGERTRPDFNNFLGSKVLRLCHANIAASLP